MWRGESSRVANGVRGAINFRNVSGTNIYCLGQPTNEAISLVLERVVQNHPTAEQVVWITLREEPLVYVHGAPYCLRLEASSLRNMKGESQFLSSMCADSIYLQTTVGSPRHASRPSKTG